MPYVAIVDYGLGNLFSVAQACANAGLTGRITDHSGEIRDADGLILTGVGAFGRAMENLTARSLIDPLREALTSGRPVLGICLGMQLLMETSAEFGSHTGLGIIPGTVERLMPKNDNDEIWKVPHVGWSSVTPSGKWEGTLLAKTTPGASFYFVHSFVVRPADPAVSLATTRYGNDTFCAVLRQGAVTACQFHPECSGPPGLCIYHTFAEQIKTVVHGGPHDVSCM